MSNKNEMNDSSIEEENNGFLMDYFSIVNQMNKQSKNNTLIRIEELPIELNPIGREAFLKQSKGIAKRSIKQRM